MDHPAGSDPDVKSGGKSQCGWIPVEVVNMMNEEARDVVYIRDEMEG